MEADADMVLRFMASNGLVANPTKTSLIFINLQSNTQMPITIRVGKEIVTQEQSANLLGMKFDQDQKWKSPIFGKGGLIPSLNSRICLLRRLKTALNKTALLKIVDGIFTSKIRYGLQLLGKVRVSESDPASGDLLAIQKIQNKLARCLNEVSLKDKVSTSVLLNNIGMLSVNQINAQTKLLEVWKAINLPNYPIQFNKYTVMDQNRITRACTTGKLVETGKYPKTLRSFFFNSKIYAFFLFP